jgi:hypothetical protein
MKIERINGQKGYGVKVILDPEERIGQSCGHTRLTRNNPNIVERELERMESDLRQQLEGLILTTNLE